MDDKLNKEKLNFMIKKSKEKPIAGHTLNGLAIQNTIIAGPFIVFV